jgi:hypothetical protein
LIANGTDTEQRVSVRATLPQGWREERRSFESVIVPARSDAEFASLLIAGPSATGGAVTVSYALEGGAAQAPPLTVRIVVRPGGNPLPQ